MWRISSERTQWYQRAINWFVWYQRLIFKNPAGLIPRQGTWTVLHNKLVPKTYSSYPFYILVPTWRLVSFIVSCVTVIYLINLVLNKKLYSVFSSIFLWSFVWLPFTSSHSSNKSIMMYSRYIICPRLSSPYVIYSEPCKPSLKNGIQIQYIHGNKIIE